MPPAHGGPQALGPGRATFAGYDRDGGCAAKMAASAKWVCRLPEGFSQSLLYGETGGTRAGPAGAGRGSWALPVCRSAARRFPSKTL